MGQITTGSEQLMAGAFGSLHEVSYEILSKDEGVASGVGNVEVSHWLFLGRKCTQLHLHARDPPGTAGNAVMNEI